MQLIAVLAATVMLCLSVEAATPVVPLPPKQYDHPFRGRLIIIDVSWREMQRRCGGPNWKCYGYTHDVGAIGTCTIYVTSRSRRLIRHEQGHCNGWGGDHRGARG